jgi:hypothetical protein
VWDGAASSLSAQRVYQITARARCSGVVCLMFVCSQRLAGAFPSEGRLALPPPQKSLAFDRAEGARKLWGILIGMGRLYRRVWALILNTKV